MLGFLFSPVICCRELAERLLLAEIVTELLSDEAVAVAQKEMRDEFKRLHAPRRATSNASTDSRLTRLNTEIEQFQVLMKAGTLSALAADAAIAALERQRLEIVDSVSRRDRTALTSVVKLLPQTAQIYRAALRDLQSTISEPSERLAARTLIFELLAGKVSLRPADCGSYLIGRVELRPSVLVEKTSNNINSFQNGSGGRI